MRDLVNPVDVDEVIDNLISLEFLEELRENTHFNLAWAATKDCLLSDELKRMCFVKSNVYSSLFHPCTFLSLARIRDCFSFFYPLQI